MDIDKEIVEKVLDNVASPEEIKSVTDWFATEEGQAYVSRRLTTESMTMGETEVEKWTGGCIPSERMKKRFLSQIKPARRLWRWWQVVAVLIPVCMLSAAVAFLADKAGVFSETKYAEIVVPCGERMQVVLQDGTSVELNSATTLRYPEKFGLFSRNVELYGEGYFKVAKDKGRPFTVRTKGLDVRVTGTQFDVKAYPEDSRIYVMLDEGSVLLKDEKSREYPLVSGESATYDCLSGKCEITRPEDLEGMQAWRSNSLNFYMMPLKDIIKVMERQYDTRFIVNDSTLLDSRYTLSTSKVNVKDVLRDLERVSRIEFIETGENTFEIRRKG